MEEEKEAGKEAAQCFYPRVSVNVDSVFYKDYLHFFGFKIVWQLITGESWEYLIYSFYVNDKAFPKFS